MVSANQRFQTPGVSGRDRRLTLDHRERGIASRLGAAEPARAKRREGGQRSIIGCLAVGQIVDEGPRVEPVRSHQRLGAYRTVYFLASEAERSLQQSGRPPDAGIDAHVEYAEIDARRQRSARSGFQ